jgi:hypothetical protein
LSEIKVPKHTAMDIAHRVVRAGLSLGLSTVPFGSLVLELYDYFIKPPLARRQEEFIHRLAVGLERLEKHSVDIESLSNNQNFITIVTQAMVISLRNHQKEKLDALQNAILNAATLDDSDVDLELIFLNYIDIFTPSHLEMLDYLDKNEFDLKGGAYAKYVTPDIYKALSSVKPKYADSHFFNVIFRDLESRELIYPMTRNVSEERYLATITTNLGKSFLEYITFAA